MEKPTYQRVLLKISGEALAGAPGRGIDFAFARQVCQVVQDCVRHGVQVGLVVGGGNFWRGVKDGGGRMERARADQMGMLATVINSLALQDVLEQLGHAGHDDERFGPAGCFGAKRRPGALPNRH